MLVLVGEDELAAVEVVVAVVEVEDGAVVAPDEGRFLLDAAVLSQHAVIAVHRMAKIRPLPFLLRICE